MVDLIKILVIPTPKYEALYIVCDPFALRVSPSQKLEWRHGGPNEACRTQDVSNVVWATVMMGLGESWRDVVAALLARVWELRTSGQLAVDPLGRAAVGQLFHVRELYN